MAVVSQVLPRSLLGGIADGFGGAGEPRRYTLAGVSFLVNGTLFRPPDFRSPEPDNVPGEARMQTWAAGGSGINAVGAGGGAGYSEDTLPIGATEAVTVPVAPAAGASGGNASVGALVIALGGQSPTGPQPGQGGQLGTGSILFTGGNGGQGGGNQNGGGGAGSEANGASPAGGTPNGGYANLPGALSGWPGGGGSSTAGAANLGRAGFVRVTWQVPSLPDAPRVIQIAEHRDTADALNRVVAAPSLTEQGDFLVLIVSSDGNPTITAAAWATGGTLAQVVGTGNALVGRAFFRTATGTAADDASVATDQSQKCTAHMYLLRDVGGNPEWTTAASSGTTHTPPPHTNSFGYRPALAIQIVSPDSNSGVALTLLPANSQATIVSTAFDNTGTILASCWAQYENNGITPSPYNLSANTNGWVATLVVPGT